MHLLVLRRLPDRRHHARPAVLGLCALCPGQSDRGRVLAAASYLTMQVRPVRGMGRVLSEMSKVGVSMQRLLAIMSAPVEEDAPGADTPAMDGGCGL